ncbi:hypothetical protein Agub_g12435 [Astrephomene gubernaculifera]|uniref:Uncharacterized protein n=1 Tax=Astrephomene gubernaculifera TaxID=47775 RepID=A0AAD3DYA6_9CHLO|nr:hypothetical protein Agub_g12435 [Astrephomene gubernaculifera]
MNRGDDDDVCTKADMHIADLMYLYDMDMVTALNIFFKKEKAPFGGFYHISDVTKELERLTAEKSNKAAELKGYLDSFAKQQGFSVKAFEEWRQVIYAKDRWDRLAQPLKTRTEDLTFLRSLINDAGSCIQPFKNAVLALVVTAEKKGLK